MIEKIARAIDKERDRILESAIDSLPPIPEINRRFARAVLKALEQPTPEMIEIGYIAASPAMRNNRWDDAIAIAFTAMIRAVSVEDETR